MGKKKKSQGTKLKYWQTPDLDCWAKGYFLLDNDFFDHPAVKVLTPSTLKVLMLLQAHSCGNDTFTYPCAAAERAGVSETTFLAALTTLKDAGFINVVSGKEKMVSNQITFSARWKSTAPEKRPRKPRGKPYQQEGPTTD